MSIVSGIASLPILLRLATPQITVKHGTLTANTKFNTNLQPSLAFIIRKVSFVVVRLDAASQNSDSNISAQLTENTTNTAPVLNDPLAIASYFKNWAFTQITGASTIALADEDVQQGSETFGGFGYPTVAASLNLTAQEVELQGTGTTNGFNVSAYIWYQIAQVDQSLQAYLSNRLALQR
jgi:hypothetical protein